MRISKRGIDLIKKYEGCRLAAYKCPAGVWTIGYGHTLNVKQGDVITQAQADQLLLQDLETYEHKVNVLNYNYHWSQNEFDALVSFAYNVGSIIGLTQYYKRTKQQIADAMLLYVNANGKPLPGLVKRRREERDLFTSTIKTNEEIAKEVIDGLWGNGKERTKRLTESGYDAKEIQKLVNKILRKTK